VRVSEAAKKLGISRQTVHEWMADGTLRWISDGERDTIWLDSDEVYRARRQRRPGAEEDDEE
jgi:excisionase family DNA binding protein